MHNEGERRHAERDGRDRQCGFDGGESAFGAVVVGTTFEKNFKMPSFFLSSRGLSSSDGGDESSEDSSDDML